MTSPVELPVAVPPPGDGDVSDRFWMKVDRSGDCWLWLGAVDKNGYGRFPRRRQNVRAHRHAYEVLVGPIPAGLQLDHLCRTRGCVNPAHLEPVTPGENVRRAYSHIRSCPQGHPYTPENLKPHKQGRGLCRECQRQWKRQRRAREC